MATSANRLCGLYKRTGGRGTPCMLELHHVGLCREAHELCPHCGRVAASPSSNLCGDALMGRPCTEAA